MWHQTVDESAEKVYLAGEKALPGVYRQIGSAREICLESEDVLPASLDGRVACYQRINYTWAQMTRQHVLKAA